MKSEEGEFSHIDENGKAVMVDVGAKEETDRTAIAAGLVSMGSEAIEALKKQDLKKGDVLGVARVAGIQAAKKTSELIPLCHPLVIDFVSIDFTLHKKTGVEMEALTACSVAALTIYDMCKAIDKSITIEEIKLVEKTGGKSGNWKRSD